MNLTKKDKTYFNIAKEVSILSNFPRIKIGCCAVYKHKVISTGCNSLRTSPLQKKYNKYRFTVDTNHTCHAETSCLKPLINRRDIEFKNVDLYIYRAYQNNELALSRPCPSCMKLISELGIRNIYYTGNKSYISEEIVY